MFHKTYMVVKKNYFWQVAWKGIYMNMSKNVTCVKYPKLNKLIPRGYYNL
jgi:hypothetical protein